MDYVYLINAKGTNRYKIGYTGRAVDERLSEMQSSSPFRLQIIDKLNASDAAEVEKGLHADLEEYRIHGEWFEFDDEMVQWLKEFFERVRWRNEVLLLEGHLIDKRKQSDFEDLRLAFECFRYILLEIDDNDSAEPALFHLLNGCPNLLPSSFRAEVKKFIESEM